MTDLYPVTIIRTRYGGAYEGGEWAAFNCDECDVPPGAIGCDSECEAFWREPKGVRVGVGGTLDQALAALAAAVEPGQVVGAKEPPHLVIRTIRDWAGVRMDDRPIRRSQRSTDSIHAFTGATLLRHTPEGTTQERITDEEAERLRKASALAFRVSNAAGIAQATIAAAQMFQTMLAGRPADPEWVEYGGTWTAFYAAGLAKSGVQLEVTDLVNDPNSRILLIGDINEAGGLCDDCTSIIYAPDLMGRPPTRVTRYRQLVREGEGVVKAGSVNITETV